MLKRHFAFGLCALGYKKCLLWNEHGWKDVLKLEYNDSHKYILFCLVYDSTKWRTLVRRSYLQWQLVEPPSYHVCIHKSELFYMNVGNKLGWMTSRREKRYQKKNIKTLLSSIIVNQDGKLQGAECRTTERVCRAKLILRWVIHLASTVVL